MVSRWCNQCKTFHGGLCRCDNCGREARKLYPHGRFQGRTAMVCGGCLQRITRGVVQAVYATQRRRAP